MAALLLTAAVLAVDLTVRSLSEGRDEEVAYLDEVRPHIEASTQQGLDLADFRANAPAMDRATFDRRLGRLVRETDETLAAVVAVEPPEALIPADALLVSTMAVRSRAATEIRDALRSLLTDATVGDTTEDINAAIEDLIIADRTYQLFLDEAGARDAEAEVPPSDWMAVPDPWRGDQQLGFLSALRSSPDLATIHDVAIVSATVSPPPVAVDGRIQVLATDEPLEVTVVVANRGSADETAVTVTVTLNIDGATQSSTEVIDIEAGAQKTVVLADLTPEVAKAATLIIDVAPVDGELATGDNSDRLRLRVRNPEATTTTAPAATTTAPPAATTTTAP